MTTSIENRACFFCSHFQPLTDEGEKKLEVMRQQNTRFAPPYLPAMCRASLDPNTYTYRRGELVPLHEKRPSTPPTSPKPEIKSLYVSPQSICSVYTGDKQPYFVHFEKQY